MCPRPCATTWSCTSPATSPTSSTGPSSPPPEPRSAGEERRDAVLGATDDGSVAPDQHRTLHEPRVLDEEVGDGFGRGVVVRREALFGEEPVLADEVGRRVLELGHEVEQGRPVERVLEVLDDLGV